MLFRALIAMITADAIDRHMREREHLAGALRARVRSPAPGAATGGRLAPMVIAA
jgi:hypothetical protein